MSEHAWILENLATYVAGGLEPAEAERFQEHITSCEACASALAEAQALDQSLETLFAAVQPGPVLEDRMIQSFRAGSLGRPLRVPFAARVALGAAAVLLLGILGAGANQLIDHGDLPFPGTPRAANATPRDSEVLFSADVSNSMSTKGAGAPTDKANPGGASNPLGYNPPARALVLTDKANQEGASGRLMTTPPPAEVKLKDADALAQEVRRSGTLETKDDRFEAFAVTDGTSNTLAFNANANGTLPGGGPGSTGLALQRGMMGLGGGLGGYGGGGMPGTPALPQAHFWGDSFADAGKSQGQGGQSHLFYTYTNNQPAPTAATGAGATAPAPARTADSPAYYKPGGLVAQPGQPPKETNDPAKPAEAAQGPGGGSGKSDKGSAKSEPLPSTPTAPATPRKIIRSGDMEFEIEAFDAAVATIIKLVNDGKGGYVDTINSEKLANGKVRGSVVVRVPPERLDALVLDLRRELGKGGELKGQRIGSQDITKQYTDLESRLRAARAMEERLLQIIKSGKGEIKDLLAAEKELGVWRTKIEEYEGELRYFANLVALSTLTITLTEKEIRAPAAVIETEQVQMGIEVEDVDKAQQQVLAAVAEAKGRITKSELKQHTIGQLSATVNFEVAPATAGPLRDRLRQLGNVARFEIDRLQQAEGGTAVNLSSGGRPGELKSRRSDVQFFVSLYNLTNVAPRETVNLNLACPDTEEVYKTILARAQQKDSRLVSSNLNRQKNEQTTGTIQFEVKTADAEAVLQTLKALGEVMRMQITENADVQNTTKSKRGFNVQLWSLGQIAPRETMVLTVAARDVSAAYQALREAVTKAKGRILTAQLNQHDQQSITAQLDFDVRRADESAIQAVLASVGDIFTRQVVSAQDSENVIDSKVRLQVGLISLDRVPPRETVVLGIEVANVDHSATVLTALVNENKGRMVDVKVAHERSGRVTAKLICDVPWSAAPGLVEQIKGFGTVRVQQSYRNAQVPEGRLSTARLDVTVSNVELIVPSDEGLWPKIRTGLSTSFVALSWSLTVVIVGVCFVLPWALVAYAVYRIVVWLRRKPVSPPTAA
jgi:hypothetical protein